MPIQQGGVSKPVTKPAPPPLVPNIKQAVTKAAAVGASVANGAPVPRLNALPPGPAPAQTDTGSSAAAAPAGAGTGTGNIGPVDWAALLGEYGMPQDVVDELNRIFSSTSDLNQAITLAQAYVRGTAWYTQTYPGIQTGINAGLFSDEQGYRVYQSQVDQIYQQYYNRAATPSEVSTYITQGQSVNRVAAGFQADAIQGNLSDPLKALFTPDELHAFSLESAGVDSALGQQITAQANLYTQVSTLYKNFYGRDVNRTDLVNLTAAGTTPQDIAQQFATAENIKAMDPAVSALFSPDEIHQIALDAAGGVTQNGKSLTDLANLATQLNPVYHQYTGNGVSRDEVNSAYQNGTPVDTIAKQFAGSAFIQANKGDIQQAEGSFGDTGQFSDAELKALGEENAGLDTPLGQAATAAYNKALGRLNGVFKGVLASPSLSFSNGRLAGQAASKPPDIPA